MCYVIIIYKITNKINNKVYIGQSHRKLEERIKQYSDDTKYRTKKIRAIIKAMRKYGFENFEFEVIEDNINNQCELDELEKYYIKKYDSVRNGYNYTSGGGGGIHSEETRDKISKSQMGELNHMWGKCGKLNSTSKRILEITTGNYYDSAMLASKELNLCFSHVCSVARGERGSTGGFVFRYVADNNKPIKPEETVFIKNKNTRENVLDEYKYLL